MGYLMRQLLHVPLRLHRHNKLLSRLRINKIFMIKIKNYCF